MVAYFHAGGKGIVGADDRQGGRVHRRDAGQSPLLGFLRVHRALFDQRRVITACRCQTPPSWRLHREERAYEAPRRDAAPDAARHKVGRGVQHRGGDRSQHRRQDGRSEDAGTFVPDGPERHAYSGRASFFHAGLQKDLRGHRRRAEHRAEPFHFQFASHQHGGDPRGSGQGEPCPAGRIGNRH